MTAGLHDVFWAVLAGNAPEVGAGSDEHGIKGGNMTVSERERDLFVVSYLEERAADNVRWLLRWAEDLGVDLAREMLADHYRNFSTLEGDDATYTNFMDRIANLASDPDLKALDVFLLVHGDRAGPVFKGGTKDAKEIGADLRALGLRRKLRALYSVACWGSLHADSFLHGGFRVVSGAIGVNANGAVEYPIFMEQWRRGKRFKMAIHATPSFITKAQDSLARAMGFQDVNSEKMIVGRPYTNISTRAD